MRRALWVFLVLALWAGAANPKDFFAPRFIDEMEQTGFLKELAARYPEAVR